MFHTEYCQTKIVQTEEDLLELRNKMLHAKYCFFDTETSGLRVRLDGNDCIVGFTVAFEDEIDERVFYVPFAHEFEGNYVPRISYTSLKLNPKDFPDFKEEMFLGEYYNVDLDHFMHLFKPLFEDGEHFWIAHNMSFDLHVLANMGINIKKMLVKSKLNWDDTMVMYHTVDEEGEKKLEKLTLHKYGIYKVDYNKVVLTVTKEEKNKAGYKATQKVPFQYVQIPIGAQYSAEDVYFMKQMYPELIEDLKEDEQWGLYRKMRVPFLLVLWKMERRGLRIDLDKLKVMQAKAEKELEKMQYNMYEISGIEFNVNSGQQVGELLYGHKKKLKDKKTGEYKESFNANLVEASFNFPITHWTEGGKEKDKQLRNPQVNEDSLRAILEKEYKRDKQKQEGQNLVKILLKYNKLKKIYTAFIMGLQEQVYQDGKVHPSINQCGCLTGETLIPTSNGLTTLKDIAYKLKVEGDGETREYKKEIINKDGCLEDTSYFVRYNNRPVKRIVTSLGFEICGTLNHPLIVNKYDKEQRAKNVDSCRTKNKFNSSKEWRKIEDIKVGDYLPIYYGLKPFRKRRNYIKLPEYKFIYNTSSKVVKFPTVINEDLAEFIGMYYADGSIRDSNGSYSVVLTNSNKQAKERFFELCKKLFGVTPKIENETSYALTSVNLAEFFKDLQFHRGCVNKLIPSYILESPQLVIEAFIRGLTLDSCVIDEGNKIYMKFTLSNKESALTLQQLLLHLGIVSSVRQDRSKTENVFIVSIYNDQYVKFCNDIGFIEEDEKQKEGWIFKNIKHNYLDDNEGTIWVLVKDIKDEVADVFDFVVPETHSFIANGFISHNTDSWRLSCSEPNMQQLPRPFEEPKYPKQGEEESDESFAKAVQKYKVAKAEYDFWVQFEIRDLIIPDDPENEYILSCDFSNLEKRITAHMTQDKNLVKLLQNGYDGHGFVATLIFPECHNLHPNEVKKKYPHLRQIAKGIGFAMDYGGTEFTVSKNLGISKEEARGYIDKYFEGFSGLADWDANQKRFGRKYGFVYTLFGHKRHLSGMRDENIKIRSYCERLCLNSPIQGTASDIACSAQILVDNDAILELLGCSMRMQIHDELVFVVPKKYIHLCTDKVLYHMSHCTPEPLIVPLFAEADFGTMYSEAH